MVRRKLIAGNWKLYKTLPEALQLATELKRLLASVRDCDLAVAPTASGRCGPTGSTWPDGLSLPLTP